MQKGEEAGMASWKAAGGRIACAILLGWGLPAAAQEAGSGDHPRGQEEGGQARERVLKALRLPGTAEEARRSGIPDAEIRLALEALRGRRLPAHEAQVVLESAAREARSLGPLENFGGFVQSQLEAGLRGQALAAAIHAEHAARGKGRPASPGAGPAGRREPGAAAGEAAPERSKRKKKGGSSREEQP